MPSFIDIQHKLAVGDGEVGISWTGQAGFAFKDSAGYVYHLDPYLSNTCSQTIGYHRTVPAPVDARNVVADVILITHDHRDHLDDVSLPVIAEANPDLTFVGPPSCIHCLVELGIAPERMIVIQRGQEERIGHAVVKAVLARHTSDSVGYVLRFGDLTCYVTGDTTYTDELIRVPGEAPHVMFACMNGRLGCMNIPDAARLTGHIQPQVAVPMHYGMFKENTADPEEFVRQVEAYSGITEGAMLKRGAWYLFDEDQGFAAVSK